jgi:O-antigen/teichoic acid export membrane protein
MTPDKTPEASIQSSSGLRRRLVLGAGATSLGPLVTLATQLVSVPIFLHFWGAEKYGEWLMIYAIPAYLAMSDMGFGTVAGNDMTMRVARGDISGALSTFQSTWRLVTLISLALAAVLLPIISVIPIGRVLHLSAIALPEAHFALLILVIDSLACLQTSLPVSGFKAAGLNHMAALGINIIRIIEGISILTAVALGRGPVFIAATLLIVRALGNLALAVTATSFIPWLHFGFTQASWSSVRELFRPAIAFMAFPASNAISLQGALLAIGIVLGPVYVAMFAPLRTVSRAAVQATEIFKLSFWPELSAAYGAGNFELARKLHRLACQLAILFNGCILLVLLVMGPKLLRIWTHGKIPIDVPTFYLLLAGVTLTSLWNTSSAVPIAANRHTRIAIEQLVSVIASLVCAIVLIRFMGLAGCALGLLVAEIYMVLAVVPASNRLLGDNLPAYTKSLCNLRPLIQILRKRMTATASS